MFGKLAVALMAVAVCATVSSTADAAARGRPANPIVPGTNSEAPPVKPAVVSSPVTLYGDARPAQQHCARDEVVWVNLATGFYHQRSGAYYARTRRGAYVCRGEADRTGFKPSPDGF